MTTTLPLPQVQAGTLEVDGRTVEYLAAGSGPVVVLLHGDGETARDWQRVLPAIAGAGHHVVALSLPGHGGSAPADSYAVEDLATWLVAIVEVLALDRATFVGSSVGGLIALHLALERPDKVERLVLVDSAGLGHLVSPLVAAETVAGIGEAAIGLTLMPGGPQLRAAIRCANLFAQPWRVPQWWWLDQLRRASTQALLEASVACKRAILGAAGQHHVLLERLGEIRVPTLVLWGMLDRVVPFTHGQAAVEQLPDARLELLPSCGHLPHVECPDAFLAAVLPFLVRAPRALRTAPSDTQRFATSLASLTGLNAAEAIVGYTRALARRATVASQLIGRVDRMLTPQRAEAVGSLLDRVEAILTPERAESVQTVLDRVFPLLSPERTAALTTLADQMPRLVRVIEADDLPTARELRQLGPDLHAILELLDEMHQVVSGVPGAKRAREHGASPHPQV